MVLREPGDVLAAIAVAFGFVPSESVTMLALGGERPLHARVDLPGDPQQLDEVLDLLWAPLEQLGPALVAFAVFSHDDRRGDRVAARLLDQLAGERHAPLPAGRRGPAVVDGEDERPVGAREPGCGVQDRPGQRHVGDPGRTQHADPQRLRGRRAAR